LDELIFLINFGWGIDLKISDSNWDEIFWELFEKREYEI
jgi:hypothetical protein